VIKMMGWWEHGSGFAYVAMSFGMIALVALGIWALVTLGRCDGGDSDSGADRSREPAGAEAERILDERLARGEIDAGEYHSRIADLHQPGLAGNRS
jgi:uncharacterized membrane protein